MTSSETSGDIEKTQIMRRRCVCVNIILTSALGPATFIDRDSELIDQGIKSNIWSEGSFQLLRELGSWGYGRIS